jgi:hypothetical protein
MSIPRRWVNRGLSDTLEEVCDDRSGRRTDHCPIKSSDYVADATPDAIPDSLPTDRVLANTDQEPSAIVHHAEQHLGAVMDRYTLSPGDHCGPQLIVLCSGSRLRGCLWDTPPLQVGTVFEGCLVVVVRWNHDRPEVHCGTQDGLQRGRRVGSLWSENGLIFASETGDPLDRRAVTALKFKPLLKRAGLPEIRFHDLRHTCATLLLTRNVNPKIVSEMLGHATIAITLDTYSHVLPNMRDAAAAAMEEALS